MDIQVLASGSGGNCYKVTDGVTPLLIECGIRFKEIQEGLNFTLSDIQGCLISHSHKDHCKSAAEVAKSGLNIYLSQPTADTLSIPEHRTKIIEHNKSFRVGTWIIKPFQTEHDCEGSLGFYMVSKSGKRLVYLTDSFYSRFTFKDVTHWMVEVNYDDETIDNNVQNGVLNSSLRDRIIRSHMSLKNAVDLFKANDLSKTEAIYALHLSSQNSNRELIKTELQKATGKQITIC